MFLIRVTPLALWLTIAASSIGCSGSLAKLDLGALIMGGRDGWQRPERVIEALAIEPGARVAEIGAGSGYWLAHLSDAVGPEGRVYAVEVTPELVERLEAQVEEASLSNVDVILGAYHDPRLPDGRVDLALTCLTYHHIEDRVRYFRSLRTDLARGARVAHLDDRPDAPAPISWFQTAGHWTPPDEIGREMGEAGYRLVDAHDFLPSQSFQVFEPRPDTEALAP